MKSHEKIRMIRKERGLTQKELGELTDLNEATIRRYELGERRPKIDNLIKIVNALDIDIEDILGEREVPIKSKIIRIRNVSQTSIEEIIEKSGITENRYRSIEEGTIVPSNEELQNIYTAVFDKEFEMPFWMKSPDYISDLDFDQALIEYENAESEVDLSTPSLIYQYEKLNSEGKEKAIELLKLLTKVPEYQKYKFIDNN